VPAEKSIFFPIFNIECLTVQAPPFFGATEEELRACANCIADQLDPASLQVSVDGEALTNLADYRVESSLFTFKYPEQNIFTIPNGPGVGKAVSDGYWIHLAPLSPGTHTVSFSSVNSFPEGECGLPPGTAASFAGNYTLHVQGKK
jgi:hypothetical protein